MLVYLGTQGDIWRFDARSGSITSCGLEAHRFWAIHAWRAANGEDTVLAGSYAEGVFRSTDSGESWTPANDGMTAFALRTLQSDPTNHTAVLAGTEPARGFRSVDGGKSWTEFEAIGRLQGADDWFLPYSPRAGALRNFAATSTGELYGSVEVGGLLHSPDGAESWRLISIDPGPRTHDDIHQVIVDPTNDERLFVAMGGALLDRTHGQWLNNGPRQIGGVAVSQDAGQTWTKLLRDYTRAVMIPSSAPNWLVAAPAQRTDHGGRITGSQDRGKTWSAIDDGIETPMEDMVERFEEAPDGSIWALCSAGRVFISNPGEWSWENPLPRDGPELRVESVSFVNA